MQIRIHNTAPVVSPEKPRDLGLYATRNHLPLIARILLSGLFIWSGVNKVLHPVATQEYMAAFGMPLTSVFLVAAIVVEIAGGLSLLLGIYPRLGAAALAAFTLVATFIFHTNLSDQIQQIMFFKNLSVIGGLLMVIQYGVGQVVVRVGKK